MNKTIKLFLFGFLTWLIPFILGFLLYPLVQSNDQDLIYLFKSIMIIVGTASGVWLYYLYFNKISEDFIKNGIITGLTWFLMNIILDLIFLVVLFQSPLLEWIFGIGLRYLNLFVIGIGIGIILKAKKS